MKGNIKKPREKVVEGVKRVAKQVVEESRGSVPEDTHIMMVGGKNAGDITNEKNTV